MKKLLLGLSFMFLFGAVLGAFGWYTGVNSATGLFEPLTFSAWGVAGVALLVSSFLSERRRDLLLGSLATAYGVWWLTGVKRPEISEYGLTSVAGFVLVSSIGLGITIYGIGFATGAYRRDEKTWHRAVWLVLAVCLAAGVYLAVEFLIWT